MSISTDKQILKTMRLAPEAGSAELIQLQPGVETAPVVSFEEKRETTRRHWELLLQQMLRNETKFETAPLFAHIQFSNYCNLSCIMCWNGKNPRTRKLGGPLLEKVRRQLGPHLSIIDPFDGSEPLTLTWDDTRKLAQEYGILLRVTTNLQFLDEARFMELKDITETICVSVDSHIPEVLAKIRQRAKTETVYRNLESTARLCREHQLECIVNFVFLTYNAPTLPDTIRYLHSVGIESINVIQMNDVNNESHFFDPVLHFSEEYIEWIKQDALKVIEELKMRMAWGVGKTEFVDFRQNKIERHPQKVLSDRNEYLMKCYFPDFCRQVYNRIRLNLDGDVAPCYLATDGQLSFGNLNDHDFEELWNGEAAQELRRGMYTNEVPKLCQTCAVRRPLPTQTEMVFADEFIRRNQRLFDKLGEDDSRRNEFVGPAHVARSESPFNLIVKACPGNSVFHVALGLGGQRDEVLQFKAKGKRLDEQGTVEITIPKKIWNRLRPNVAYWWAAWQRPGWSAPLVRTDVFACFIKSSPLGLVELVGPLDTQRDAK